MYYLESGYDKHHRMRNAMSLALLLHAAVILGLSFQYDPVSYRAPQVEVTLATNPGDLAPDDTRHVAQANQEGSDEPADPAPPASQAQALPQPAEAPAEPQRDAITTAAAALRAESSESPEREQLPRPGVSPRVDELTRELANLEAALNEQSRSYAEMPRVRRLTSVATRHSVDAAYLLDWRKRVEAVGNKYYPEASVRYGIYGKLRLLVAIRADGSLHDIRVLSSSGFAVLDEAAIKIVRMAAPFAPFPAELRETTDLLEIIRTWQFQENRLSSQ